MSGEKLFFLKFWRQKIMSFLDVAWSRFCQHVLTTHFLLLNFRLKCIIWYCTILKWCHKLNCYFSFSFTFRGSSLTTFHHFLFCLIFLSHRVAWLVWGRQAMTSFMNDPWYYNKVLLHAKRLNHFFIMKN